MNQGDCAVKVVHIMANAYSNIYRVTSHGCRRKPVIFWTLQLSEITS